MILNYYSRYNRKKACKRPTSYLHNPNIKQSNQQLTSNNIINLSPMEGFSINSSIQSSNDEDSYHNSQQFKPLDENNQYSFQIKDNNFQQSLPLQNLFQTFDQKNLKQHHILVENADSPTRIQTHCYKQISSQYTHQSKHTHLNPFLQKPFVQKQLNVNIYEPTSKGDTDWKQGQLDGNKHQKFNSLQGVSNNIILQLTSSAILYQNNKTHKKNFKKMIKGKSKELSKHQNLFKGGIKKQNNKDLIKEFFNQN